MKQSRFWYLAKFYIGKYLLFLWKTIQKIIIVLLAFYFINKIDDWKINLIMSAVVLVIAYIYKKISTAIFNAKFDKMMKNRSIPKQ